MPEIKLTNARLQRLFKSIGGEQRLEEILIQFYVTMSKDVLVGFFFDGRNPAEIAEIARKQKAFLLRAWGAAPSYSGKAPADAHTQLPPILKGHFDRRLVLLVETLRNFKLDETSIETWVQFEESFRAGIVK